VYVVCTQRERKSQVHIRKSENTRENNRPAIHFRLVTQTYSSKIIHTNQNISGTLQQKITWVRENYRERKCYCGDKHRRMKEANKIT